MSFEIQKNIVLDGLHGNVKPISECPFPFSAMDIGDSFYVTGTFQYLIKSRSNIQHWVRKFRKSVSKNFSVATRTEGDGFRVWRIS